MATVAGRTRKRRAASNGKREPAWEMLRRVDDFVVPRNLGEVQMAPLPVKLFSGQIREPDIVFFEAQRVRDLDDQPLDGADLVMEIPSPGRRTVNAISSPNAVSTLGPAFASAGSSIRRRTRSRC